jgi:hypothetical protein
MLDVVVELIDEERRGRKEERWERNARLLNASEYRAKGFTELRSQHRGHSEASQSPPLASGSCGAGWRTQAREVRAGSGLARFTS